MIKKVGLFFGMVIFSLCLGAISALAYRNVVSVYGTQGDSGFDAVVSCNLTGEDANWCYYDCTCTGRNATDSKCDQLYAAAGLIDA